MDITAFDDLVDLLSQDTRFIRFNTPVASDLLVEKFDGVDAINQDFHFNVDCVSTSAHTDPHSLIGQPATLGLSTDTGERRYWHAYITQAASLGGDGGLARYRLVLQSALAFLDTRRNTLVFQDQNALAIIGSVFADHPQLAWRNDSTAALTSRPICTQYRETDLAFVTRLLAEEGLSYRFEHLQAATPNDGQAGHTLVVFDADASQSLPLGSPASVRFHRLDATEKTDSLTRFSEKRQVVVDQITTSSWVADQVQAIAGNAQAAGSPQAPELPTLDQYEANHAQAFNSRDEANRLAARQLDHQRLWSRYFTCQGAVRHLQPGKTYLLTKHASFPSLQFVPYRLHHHATNNLSVRLARLLGHNDDEALGKGSYRQHFTALPAGTRIVTLAERKPLAPGCASAQVVGVDGSTVTSNRDHQVRVQYFWQRGNRPLAGGQTDTASSANPDGHATGDERSGTWVRVAEAAAGADQGQHFVPRIGDEVLVEFAHGDIDQPVVVGQLYNGQARSAFAAGVDSGINHPGTLSGIHTQHLDDSPAGRWQLDDAAGQLSHHLEHSLGQSGLHLGYLIDYNGAQRGAYRGDGFDLSSDAWAVSRAGNGLMLSTSARFMGQSTQMDASNAAEQLQAATQNAKRLDAGASQATATGFSGNSALSELHAQIDNQQNGKYSAPVNGQDNTQPNGQARHGGDPVHRFNQPALLLDTPNSLAFTTANSSAHFAGKHQHLTTQQDAQLTAGATLALAAGNTASLYAANGGLKAIANHGPVSLAADDGTLNISADKDATVTSSNDSISVLANSKICLTAGQSSITLQGGNVTISCPGTFAVKTATHNFTAGQAKAATLPALPSGTAQAVSLIPPLAKGVSDEVDGIASQYGVSADTTAPKIENAYEATIKLDQPNTSESSPSLMKPVLPVAFHIVRKPTSLSTLLPELYTDPTDNLLSFTKRLNPHLSDQLAPGQLLILSHPKGTQNSAQLVKLQQAQAKVEQARKQLDSTTQQATIDHFKLLGELSSIGSAGVGAAATSLGGQLKVTQDALIKIEDLYKQTYSEHGNLNTPEFFKNRQRLFKQLDNSLGKMTLRDTGFKDTFKLKHKLGLSTKSILHNWKESGTSADGIPGYAENYARIAKYSKWMKHAGYVGIALDGVNSVAKIADACSAGRECEKTAFVQSGRSAGSATGGYLGALGAYAACNVIFGVETAGTSLLWCGLVATGVGGFAGGTLGGEAGKETGVVLYHTKKALFGD